MSNTRNVPVPRESSGERLDKFLTKAVPGLSLDRARLLIDQGRVRIRGKHCKAERKLWGNETVEVEQATPAPMKVKLEGPDIPVMLEDGDLVVVNKPPGLLVEHDHSTPSVVDLLAARLKGFNVDGRAVPGVVHRLDRDTSGCLALAKTDAAVHALVRGFQEKKVDKRYLVVVLGTPPDTLAFDTPYGRDPQEPSKYTTKVASARRARLTFTVLERFADCALIEVDLDTGRTHQIRVQLSEAGYPVIGDAFYGTQDCRVHPAATALGRHALHARMLEIPHPRTGELLLFESPLPEDFERALALLRGGAA